MLINPTEPTSVLTSHREHMRSIQDAVTATFNPDLTASVLGSELTTDQKAEIQRNIVVSNRTYATLCPQHAELAKASPRQRRRIRKQTHKHIKQTYTGSLSFLATIWFWYQWGSRILAVVDFVFDLMTEPETLAEIKELYEAPKLYVNITGDFDNPSWHQVQRIDDPGLK